VHLYIPLWLCLLGGAAIVLVVGIAIAVAVAVGVADADQVLDTMLWKPYPVPRDGRTAQPRQDSP
jgi:hypothetical protein